MNLGPRKLVITFFILILLVGGGYAIWTYVFDTSAKEERARETAYKKYLEYQKRYEDAMRADTYGGKTPQETLDLFVAALKKGDIELASKYFILEGNADGTFGRKKYEEALMKAKSEGRLEGIATLISKATFDPETSYRGTAWFYVYDSERQTTKTDINLDLNKYSGIWKIQSL